MLVVGFVVFCGEGVVDYVVNIEVICKVVSMGASWDCVELLILCEGSCIC